MSTKQILIKNTFWLSAIEFFSKILMFLVVVSLVRYWGATEFGAYNLSFAYVSIFMIIADFGLSTITIREVAKDKSSTSKYLGNLFSIKIFLSLIISLLFFLSFLFLNKPVSLQLLVLTLIYSLIQNFQNIFITIFQAWEKMEMVFINRLIFFVGVLLTALAVIKFQGQATHLVVGYSLSTLIAIGVGFIQSKFLKIKIKIEFDFPFCLNLIKESLPLLGMTAATIIYANNDTLLIGRYFGNDQVGFYQTAYKILFAFQSINVINFALFPRLSILRHENNQLTFKKLTKLILILSIIGLIPLALIITWQQQLIIKLIYGPNFLIASSTMSLLIWSGVINYFRNFAGNLLIIGKNQKSVFFAVAIGAIFSLFINYFLIPKNGFIQGAWTLILCETIILIAMIIKLKLLSPRDNHHIQNDHN